MTQLIDGLVLTANRVQNETFIFRGKEVRFERNENNPNILTARTNLSQEEKDAGNLDFAFTFNIGEAEGTIAVNPLPPEDERFDNLNDSEKLTKLNSVPFQYNTIEPTDVGEQLDTVLQKSYSESDTAKQTQKTQGQQQGSSEIKITLTSDQIQQLQQNEQDPKEKPKYEPDARQKANMEVSKNVGGGTSNEEQEEEGDGKTKSKSRSKSNQSQKDKELNDQIKEEINLAEVKAADA